MNVHTQNLIKHQWKDRVVLVISNDDSNQNFQDQIKALKTSGNGLINRKIVIYHVTSNKFKTENPTKSHWIYDSSIYSTYNDINAHFKIVLIGLDGSIKLEQKKILSLSELYDIIDSMPMRKTEIKHKK